MCTIVLAASVVYVERDNRLEHWDRAVLILIFLEVMLTFDEPPTHDLLST